MSVSRPAFAAGLHAAAQRRTRAGKVPQAFMTRISTSSANRILKASRTVEEMVATIVGKKETQEESPKSTNPVESKFFQNFIYGTIMLNAVTLGMQADLSGDPWDVIWLVCENIFTAIFTVELVLKLYFLRTEYFYIAERQGIQFWNLLDLVIVLLAIVDCWVLVFYPETDTQLIRVMQLLRIMRIAKLLRLRRELVAIIEGLFCSMQCMVWIGFLLMIVIYAFGIFCRNVMGSLSNNFYDDMVNNEMYFGTLPRTMLTLFNICLIDGWSTVVWPQMLYNPLMVVPLMIFLCVTCFGLMNALIGVIVERTTAAHQSMNTIEEEVLRESKMRMVAQLLDVMDSSDEDDNGTINLEEFRQVQKKPYASDIFAALNLPPGFDASDLFGLLDNDGNGVLDRYEFLLGICRLIWCDEFQSQCLLNYGISKVRQDVRNLHNDVREVLEVHRAAAQQGPSEVSQERPKPEQQMADLHKSITESLQTACQDILQKHLEQYWQSAVHADKDGAFVDGLRGKAAEKEQTDDEVSLLDFCTIAEQQQPATLDAGRGLIPASAVQPSNVASGRRVLCSPEDVAAESGPELLSVMQLSPAAAEVLQGRLEELTQRSAARRIALDAAGHLVVDGSYISQQRVKQTVHELLQAGHDVEDKAEAPQAVAAAKRRRRRRRNHDGQPSQAAGLLQESPPSPPPAPSSPEGEPLEVRVTVGSLVQGRPSDW